MRYFKTISWTHIAAVLAVIASGFTGYMYQQSEVSDLEERIFALERQVQSVSREVAPKGSAGASTSPRRIIRVFLTLQTNGKLLACDTSAPVGPPRRLFISRDTNGIVTDPAYTVSVATRQGLFSEDIKGENACVIEYLFVDVPIQDSYIIRTTYSWDEYYGTWNDSIYWEVEGDENGTYEEVTINLSI